MQPNEVTIVHELDLGGHSLFIMSDQSIDITDFSGERYHADNVMSLTSEETYKLFISLKELFQ